MTLALHIGPIQFDQPIWLAVAPICWALAVWIGRQTLSGLGTTSRRVALVVRLMVILLLAGAIAKPQWRREAKSVNVTVVVDASDSVARPVPGPDGKPVELLKRVDQYLEDAAGDAKPGDTISRLTAAAKAYVQSLPVTPREKPDTLFIGATDGTNLQEAVALALSIPAKDSEQGAAAKRILMISDWNETTGSVEAAAAQARAAKVPIDVLPIRYKFDQEVKVDRIVVPSQARMGQNVVARVLLHAVKPARGKLSLLINGDQVRLGDGPGEMDLAVQLDAGDNVVSIPVLLPTPGATQFKAVFTPETAADDSIPQNNQSLAVTFVQSQGRVLIVASSTEEVAPMRRALTDSKIDAVVRSPEEAPTSLVDWTTFDSVVLANVPSDKLTQQQQEDLRNYVHDLGGGLLMVGGPNSFGAGGWIGSPVADALPVKLDPPQQRKMPRGALVLLMHSCEVPRGNYWGQQVALAAVNNLSRLDLVGMLEYSFAKGDWWVHPINEVGNKSAVTRAINSLTFGDMPSFDNLLNMAYQGLSKADAGARHIIIISDGDPQLMDQTILPKCRAARISISTVLVYPHNRARSGPDWDTMRRIARETRGNFYGIVDEGEFATLPSIFIKEAQVVKRSLIWEGDAFTPTLVSAVSEPMRGLATGGFPKLTGYVVTAEREGLSVVSLRGKESDPLLAHWQYGLGKSVAFTSDASVRWSVQWPSWGKYRAFWEQHVRWAMRPTGNADMRVTTEDLGDRTKVVVEALDAEGDRLNFVRFAGRVSGPGGVSQPVELRQVGPGRYEGVFDSARSGAYLMTVQYTAPGGSAESGSGEQRGTVQAAVTRPYADEFRSLQDNAQLGRRIAEMTGGRVVSDDPRTANLWERAGLNMPVDARPIWVIVACVGLGTFLMDVAVRRVRIDPAMIAAAIRRGLGQQVQQAGQQLGSLKEARERAQQAMGPRGDGATGRRKAGGADAATAKTKFEATEDELKGAKTNQAMPTFEPEVQKAKPAQSQAQDAADQAEGGLSRLKKARERAQEKFEEDDQR